MQWVILDLGIKFKPSSYSAVAQITILSSYSECLSWLVPSKGFNPGVPFSFLR